MKNLPKNKTILGYLLVSTKLIIQKLVSVQLFGSIMKINALVNGNNPVKLHSLLWDVH